MVYVGLLCYALCVLLANIFVTTFVYFDKVPVIEHIPYIETLPLSIGTIFFGAIFTLRDHLHRSGLKYVYIGIALSLLVTLTYNYYNDIPGQIIFASFFSLFLSELTNTAVFQRYIHQTWYKKVLKSNAASVPVDSTLFAFMAFYGTEPIDFILKIILADIIFKFFFATLVILIPKDFFRSKKNIEAARQNESANANLAFSNAVQESNK
ncbi:VUT family protein [Thorsellia kenyensis]|uniref:VUT family protein n=1 Tax=Thorsellia kenyensis TaxID=1549888 RepID=A0ABV6C9L5_9GAMM